MATATLVHIGAGWDLAPGQKHTWVWSDPVPAAVYDFAARPKARAAAGWGREYQAQIGKVTYWTRAVEGAPSERKIYIEVTNPGAELLHYDLFLSVIA